MAKTRTELSIAMTLALAVVAPAVGLAAVEGDVGVSLTSQGGGAPAPEVMRFTAEQIVGHTFAAPEGRVLEFLLVDGTTITMAPHATLSVDAYHYDPETRSGSLVISGLSGLVRIVAGRGTSVEVSSATARAKLRTGAATFRVGPDGDMRASLLLGGPLVVAAGGETETLRVPGYAVSAGSGGIGSPELRAAGEVEAETSELNPALPPIIVTETLQEEKPAAIEQLSQVSETRQQPASGPIFPGFGNGSVGGSNVSNPFGGAINPLNLSGENPSDDEAGLRGLSQARDPSSVVSRTVQIDPRTAAAKTEGLRFPGITASRYYSSLELNTLLFNNSEDAFEIRAGERQDDAARAGSNATTLPVLNTGSPIVYTFLETFSSIDNLRSFRALNLVTIGGEREVTFFPGFEGGERTTYSSIFSTDLTEVADGGIRLLDSAKVLTNIGLDAVTVLQTGFTPLIELDPETATIWDSWDTTGFDPYDRQQNNMILIEAIPVSATVGNNVDSAQSLLNDLGYISQDGELDNRGTFRDGSENPVSTEIQDLINAIIFEQLQTLKPGEHLDVKANFGLTLADTEWVIKDNNGDDLELDALTLRNYIDDLNQAAPGSSPNLNAGVNFLFATGGVDIATLSNVPREDVFVITPSLFALGGATSVDGIKNQQSTTGGVRAFLPNSTRALGSTNADGVLALADTGLRVIGVPDDSKRLNFETASSAQQSAAVHADFGIQGLVGEITASNGFGGYNFTTPGNPAGLNQVVTISATIGDVAYDVGTGYKQIAELQKQTSRAYFGNDGFLKDDPCPAGGCNDLTAHETILTARTIGSSRGLYGDGTDGASIVSYSDLFTTASGGGNGNLAADETRAGFFVLDNYDPVEGEFRYAEGGSIAPVLGSGADVFALQRIAIGTSSSAELGNVNRSDLSLRGFAASLAETRDGRIVALQTKAPDGSGFVGSADASANRIGFGLELANRSDGGTVSLILGGLDQGVIGASAFLDNDRFAARTPGLIGSSTPNAETALVSAELLQQGAATANPETAALLDAMSAPTEFKWGFFFGDAVDSNGTRVHSHLGTWIAAETLSNPSLLDGWVGKDPAKIPGGGTATYAGPAIGNVATSGHLYDAVGMYTNTWNFAARSGQATLQFDGANISGVTNRPFGQPSFSGVLTGANTARVGQVGGAFVGGGPAALPTAQIGTFGISDGSGYSATGTFGAQAK